MQPCPPEACALVAADSYFSHTNKKFLIAINSSSGKYRACFEDYGDFNLACRQNVPGEMTQGRKRSQKLPMRQQRVWPEPEMTRPKGSTLGGAQEESSDGCFGRHHSLFLPSDLKIDLSSILLFLSQVFLFLKSLTSNISSKLKALSFFDLQN